MKHLLHRIKMLWWRATNPSKAFVEDVFFEVDNNPPNPVDTRRFLESMGYDVTQFEQGIVNPPPEK